MILDNMKMSSKLPLAFVALTLSVSLVISIVGYNDFKAALLHQTEQKLRIITHERAEAYAFRLGTFETMVETYATDPTVIEAVDEFQTFFTLLMDDPETELQQAYNEDNPHPLGQKDLLDRAPIQIPYHALHEKYHPTFRSIKNNLELYDLFLFDPEGNLIYSVYKEADFATNFLNGPYSDSGLGKAFRLAANDQDGQVHFIDFEPYAPSAGAAASFMSSPLFGDDGALIGVLAIQLPANVVNEIIVNEHGLLKTGEITLVGADMRARTPSRFEDRHQLLDPLTLNTSITGVFDSGEAVYIDELNIHGEPAIGVAEQFSAFGYDWAIVGEFALDEVLEEAYAQAIKTTIFSTFAMGIVAFCGWLVSRSFSTPLNSVVGAMTQISQRDYDINLPGTKRGDEIGDLSRALMSVSVRLRDFDDKLAAEQEAAEQQKFAVSELGAGLKRLAKGDLSSPLNRAFSAEYDALRVDYNDTVTQLGETITNLKKFSSLIGDQTSQISQDSSELSQRTENQAATLEETAAAIEQITETITQSSSELRSAESLILEADGQVKQGRIVVKNTTAAMDQIEQSSEEISSIIRVVDDIAFQTNLLALNAGVEAARAGDAGRGFAVVAAEVRQLAMRSAEAVSQIKTLIQTSASNVDSGVKLVRDTESVLMEIVQRMEGISTLITSVAGGAEEQSSSIGEINIGVNQLDKVTQQNAAMVENSSAGARALSSEANNLVEMLERFKVRGPAKDGQIIEMSGRFNADRNVSAAQ